MEVEEVLDRLERIVGEGYNQKEWKELDDTLVKLPEATPENPAPMSSSQLERVLNIAVELLMQGYPELKPGDKMGITILMAALLRRSGFRDDTYSKMAQNTISPEEYSVIYRILGDFLNNLLTPEEQILIIRQGVVEIGNRNSLRSGFIVVTNERLFVVGRKIVVSTKDADHYYLSYEDRSTKQFYGSVDIVEFDAILEMKMNYGRIRKGIVIDLKDVRYVKYQPQIARGPYVKIRLPDKVVPEQGDLKLVIRIAKGPAGKKDHKKSHIELHSTLQDALELYRSRKIPPTSA